MKAVCVDSQTQADKEVFFIMEAVSQEPRRGHAEAKAGQNGISISMTTLYGTPPQSGR